MSASFLKKTKDGVQIFVRLTPRAKKDRFDGQHGGRLKIALTSPPVEGKANSHLIRILAKKLKLPKSAVTIVSGETAREKTIRIPERPLDELEKLLLE